MCCVDKLQKLREDDQHKHRAEIAELKQAMREQLDIAKEAVSTMTHMRQELAVSRAESRMLHAQLRERQTSYVTAGPRP